MGLKIRDVNDTSPPLITENSEVLKDDAKLVPWHTATHIVINANPKSDNTNVINRIWKMVMDKVMDVLKDTAPHIIDYMMTETIDSDQCYECDGKKQKSRESKNQVKQLSKCNTSDQEQKEEKEILEEVLKMPSCSLQRQAQTQTEHDITDNQPAITVGDYVTIFECPAHWLWVSPFTVRAIESDWVALELVDELIEMGRLEKCRVQK